MKMMAMASSRGWLEGVQGGNMLHGFMMGAVSSAGGYAINEYASSLGKVGEVAANAVLSGTVSEIGGGKFANGAITGAFAMMFNEMMHPQGQREKDTDIYAMRRNLKKNIEADGSLSYGEAVEWWKVGQGGTLSIDVNSLNLDFLDLSNTPIGGTWSFSVRPGGLFQWAVYGTVTAGYLGNNTITLFPDTYDFDIKPNLKNDPSTANRNVWTRRGAVINGKGTPFNIFFYGKYKVK